MARVDRGLPCSTQEQALYAILGYTFKDPALLVMALTHRSASKANNERLEFLGDAILSFVIAECIYHHKPSLQEGDMSQIRSNLVSGKQLARVAKDLGVGPYLRFSVGEQRSGGNKRASHLANAMEAIIAAIFLDSDLSTCKKCITQWFAPYLKDMKGLAEARDPKSTLQELLQKQKIPLPKYSIVGHAGKEHAKVFTVRCYIEALKKATEAQGRTRREAEQAAAKQLLEQLQ